MALLLILIVTGLLGAAAAVEFRARQLGHRPYVPSVLERRIEPGGRVYQIDPLLGYKHLPGRYTITLKGSYAFEITHLDSTLRATGPLDELERPDERDEVWIFGCSFTHGWSLHDHETFPWLLQTDFPDLKIVNFGVGGYGTQHSLIQFLAALKAGRRPALVLLTYSQLHDARNVFARSRRKGMTNSKLSPVRHPAARLAGDGSLRTEVVNVTYSEFPFMRSSAAIHRLEKAYNAYEERRLRSHEVSRALVDAFFALSDVYGVTTAIVGITNHDDVRKMLAFCEDHNRSALDISVDLTISGHNNLPHDGHPSAKANFIYAERLGPLIKSLARPG
ncbi:MAG: SGNH/GDSL hydrolase family protein [Pseudomonadota bacterium]